MNFRQWWAVLFFILSIFAFGCGGGGGVYYPQQVAENTINLQKVELSKTGIHSYHRQFFPIAYTDQHIADRIRKEGMKIFGREEYFQEVNFLGTEYYVYRDKGRMKSYGVDLIRKSDMKRVLFLPTPRYSREFAVFPITMGNQALLVIYVEQQSTSHSSTLFILNSQFRIVYQEHLLGAEEIGYTYSDQYGNCIVLKTENFWFPNGNEKPLVTVTGDWLYYIPAEKE